MKKKYLDLLDFDTGNVWHVYPVNDLKAHILSGGKVCWCNPRVEKQVNDALIIIHKSKDGREFLEWKGGER